jgi:hypothetical protein
MRPFSRINFTSLAGFFRANIFYTLFIVGLLGLGVWDGLHHYWWSLAWDAIIIGWLVWDLRNGMKRPKKGTVQ